MIGEGSLDKIEGECCGGRRNGYAAASAHWSSRKLLQW